MADAAPLADLKARLIEQAHALGFATVGFAPAADDALRAERLREWLDAGMHGEMEWMEARADVRQGPQAMWAEAQSVIALGMSYAPDADPLALAGDPERARISVYAQGGDYHDLIERRLREFDARMQSLGGTQRFYVDTGPVLERDFASDAGLGWNGKSTLQIHRRLGTWFFLAELLTTLDLPPDEPFGDHCGKCTACITACPTQAITAPRTVDARRCISYLTIEHKGPIPEEFREAIGNRIYGCDDCLAVCPWNKFAMTAARHRAFLPRAELAAPRLAELLALDDAGFRRLFAGSPIKRIGRNRFVRNCLIAAGNSGNAALEAPVRALLADPDPVVAEAAGWALARLLAVAASPELTEG